METAASLIAFIQVAGKIVELIIEVNQLWSEAKDLPSDLRDILEELDDYALVFEELKEQIEYDQTHNTRSNGSCMSRSFMAATKAKEILKDLVEEINMTIHSKKEGLQRRLSSFKLLMKKEKIERYQKRLQRSIKLLQTAISTYQIAMMRQNTEIIVGRVTDNFSEKFEYLQLNQTSMLATSATYQTEQKQLCGSSNSKQQELCTPQRGRLPSSKPYTSSWTGHFSMSRTSAEGAWQAYLQLPSWLSQSTHIFQSYPTRSGWTFNYRVYNIVAPDSEIIARIHSGDKNGVLELFSARKASPFDKDSNGASLLYHAARSKHYDICKLLLNMGLEDTLFDVVGRDRESPLKPLVYNPEKDAMGHDWERIVTLFQTYLQDPEDMPVTRLFDFLHEWAHSDNFVFIFRTRFMPKYYIWPSRIRFEAVRLGSFHLRSCASLPKLLSEDSKVSQLDVSLSSHENFSLLHSAAISLGIRFADEAIPKRRGEFQWSTYNDGWDDFVIDVASVSESEDLHHVEAVSPWDVYKVPQWKGTPLFSLIGGTLCYLTTGTSFFHWNHVFQKALHQWLEDLKIAGVDLLQYGTRERGFFRDQVLRGAFDSNAITSSRVLIREAMANGSYDTNMTNSLRENISENHWIPIRLVDLKVGKDITDWEVLWAPEFEYMACEFWRLFEEEENAMIPGAWVED